MEGFEYYTLEWYIIYLQRLENFLRKGEAITLIKKGVGMRTMIMEIKNPITKQEAAAITAEMDRIEDVIVLLCYNYKTTEDTE